MRIFLLLIAVVVILGIAELAASPSSSPPPSSAPVSRSIHVKARRLRDLAHTELKGGRLAIARHDYPQASFWMKQARATISELHQLIYGN